MPELPEVEAARRGIAEQLAGKRLVDYAVWQPRIIVADQGLTLDDLLGRRLDQVERRGKYLALSFEEAGALVHLKLSGQLAARGARIAGFAAGHPVPAFDAPLPHKSTHLRLDFEDGSHLFLTDIRHFARVRLLPSAALPETLDRLALGPDVSAPTFSVAMLGDQLRRRLGKLKPVLLDQTVVAGLGNIYVDESLWQAALHPERSVSSLDDDDLERLHAGIVTTMQLAIPLGGARILHGKARTDPGTFPFVHGREGLPCPRCGTPIVKTRVGGRGTYTCPRCQPLLG